MPIKAAFLDYNGTCLDDVPLNYRSSVALFRYHNIYPIPTLEQYRSEMTSDYMAFYYNHGLPARVSQKDVNFLRGEYYSKHFSEAKLRDDLHKTVIGLKSRDIRTAIVSAEAEAILRYRLGRAGLLELFDPIRCDCINKKVALTEVVTELGINPAQVMYIDDSVDGNKAALDSGLIPVGFSGGMHSADRLRQYSKYIINELSEVLSIVDCFDEIEGFQC